MNEIRLEILSKGLQKFYNFDELKNRYELYSHLKRNYGSEKARSMYETYSYSGSHAYPFKGPEWETLHEDLLELRKEPYLRDGFEEVWKPYNRRLHELELFEKELDERGFYGMDVLNEKLMEFMKREYEKKYPERVQRNS